MLISAWTAIKTIGIKVREAAASVRGHRLDPGGGAASRPRWRWPRPGPMSFVGRIASAEGGFDVPRGLNPVTQLHQEEMVLPRVPCKHRPRNGRR